MEQRLVGRRVSVVCEAVRCFSRVADLGRCMFIVTDIQAPQRDEMELVIEDGMAGMYAQLARSVVWFRMRRCLHWFRWSTKLFCLLDGRGVAAGPRCIARRAGRGCRPTGARLSTCPRRSPWSWA